jgi:hypothetical protein
MGKICSRSVCDLKNMRKIKSLRGLFQVKR